MAAWRWLYEHPDATPARFREAVVFDCPGCLEPPLRPAPRRRDVPLLGIYTHMVNNGLYLPDYPLGHLIAFQIEEHFRRLNAPMGPEFERLCQLGSITPDAWMRQGIDAPLSAEPLLAATERALADLQRRTD